jgi:hypothetical protein
MMTLRVEFVPCEVGSNLPALTMPELRLWEAAPRVDKPEFRVRSVCVFCIRHGSFDGGRDDPYLTRKRSHLNVNPYRFYSDFRHGVELYPSDLRKAKPTDELRQDFDKTFDKIFVQRG